MSRAALLELPPSREALAAERRRVERELAATRIPAAVRLLAIHRRRVVIAEALAAPAIAAPASIAELLERDSQVASS